MGKGKFYTLNHWEYSPVVAAQKLMMRGSRGVNVVGFEDFSVSTQYAFDTARLLSTASGYALNTSHDETGKGLVLRLSVNGS
jgi:hypothetical protein